MTSTIKPRSMEPCRAPCSNTDPLIEKQLIEREPWPQGLRDRALYHITPLHYVPSILSDQAIYAKSVLAAKGIEPRASAKRRDKMLGLDDFVHLAFDVRTPILADKLSKGYPHAVLIFDARALAKMPGHALLPYNTKAWRSRAVYAPVTDDIEKARLLYRRDSFGELQSLEFLVKYGVGLESLSAIAFVSQREFDAVSALCGELAIPVRARMHVDNTLSPPGYSPVTIALIEEYFTECRIAGSVLSPPTGIRFD